MMMNAAAIFLGWKGRCRGAVTSLYHGKWIFVIASKNTWF